MSIINAVLGPAAQMINRRLQNLETALQTQTGPVGKVYSSVKSTFQEATGTGAYSAALPGQGMSNANAFDPGVNLAAAGADKAHAKMNSLYAQLEAAGDNPSPSLQLKLQVAMQAYQAFMQLAKSFVDGKKETQQALARF
ncbi:MAG: hypothetical protein JNK82_01430 [Myxococcaceae bacterium]|nr:hypothetical protein [Myxococcaceae bacterium]